MAEDAASVLEQFVQDVANLPAEIAHLLEEIQAKDRVIQECRNVIATRDSSIQKFLKLSGAGQPNPKEEGYCKNVMANFDKAQVIQEEKVGLSEKAASLLDRQIKRLDFKIRDLQNEGAIQPDPQLPSLLNNNTPLISIKREMYIGLRQPIRRSVGD
ncbi:MAG: Histone acetyltransferase complex subunit [Alectoria sarmentosa]|nr:MAG: Histone acetyltransferase complex subunit [Alectoria sarmentosa]